MIFMLKRGGQHSFVKIVEHMPWLPCFQRPCGLNVPVPEVRRTCRFTIANMYKMEEGPAAIIPVIHKVRELSVLVRATKSRTFLLLRRETCPDETNAYEFVQKLAVGFFVQNVETPSLAALSFRCFEYVGIVAEPSVDGSQS